MNDIIVYNRSQQLHHYASQTHPILLIDLYIAKLKVYRRESDHNLLNIAPFNATAKPWLFPFGDGRTLSVFKATHMKKMSPCRLTLIVTDPCNPAVARHELCAEIVHAKQRHTTGDGQAGSFTGTNPSHRK